VPPLNPWIALPDGGPSAARTRQLRAAHELFVGGARPSELARRVRRVVLDSWSRCLGSGVDPDGSTPPVELMDDDLLAYRAAHPLAGAMPVIRRLLVQDAVDDRMIVAVTDAAGRMLWVEGDPRLRSRAAGMNFVEGARWSEDVAGTNAPGTALALDHSVQIHGSEHFRRPVQPWSCSAAPVHDPFSGRLLGAIDVTGGDHVASPHVLTLVRATAAAVESELRWQLRERSEPRRPAGPAPRPAPRLAVLGRDRALLSLPTGRHELSLRHSELLLLLAEASVAGEGRTAEQLAAEVHRGDAAAVTVRAELSRVRRLVGPQLVGSRPYRLLGRLDTDLDTVRRLLGRGAVGEALQAYPGAVLPRSQAPGVAVARERVAALLRQGVLRSGRPELLVRYASLPEARDDAAVWQACLERMPPGSPHRATAAANLLRLRRTPHR
jgi:GAF domain